MGSNAQRLHVLVIEDHPDTRKFLDVMLRRDFDVSTAENAIEGLEMARQIRPNIILLDVMLPLLSGYDACAQIKADPDLKNIPVIFLSAKNAVSDITSGFGLGADDYLPKPFDYQELKARILARTKQTPNAQPTLSSFQNLTLDLEHREAIIGKERIVLTPTEFDLVRYFLQNVDKEVSRETLIQSIWRTDRPETNDRTIDVHIRALRKKIPTLAAHLLSIYGVGYKLNSAA